MSTAKRADAGQARQRLEAPFKLGDRVAANGLVGTIVADIDTGEYAPAVRGGGWSLLTSGVLVRWDDATITHLLEPSITLRAFRES